jgi:[ribosomal protein S5]-alanine N-acetyltransferase
MLQPIFTPFPELRTERLLLRRLTKDDVPEIFFLRSDEEVLKFLGKEPAKTFEEAETFIDRIDNTINTNEGILWGIALKDDPGKIIGTICYWQLQPEHYRTEIGYALHPGHWRKGIMKEAILKVLEYGFKTMQLNSVEARLSDDNIASAAVLEKTGFIKEGHFKEDFFFRGKFSNTIVYSRLR